MRQQNFTIHLITFQKSETPNISSKKFIGFLPRKPTCVSSDRLAVTMLPATLKSRLDVEAPETLFDRNLMLAFTVAMTICVRC